MGHIAVDLDNTLINKDTHQPEPGAAEAMQQLLEEGHRVSIWTARFAPMPIDMKEALKVSIENELKMASIPYSDIWMGTTKPNADIFIGDNCVTYDGNWQLALAQAHLMMTPKPEEQPQGI